MKPSEILSSRDRAETKFYLICNNHSLPYWSSALKEGAYSGWSLQSYSDTISGGAWRCPLTPLYASWPFLSPCTTQLMTSAELKELNTCYLLEHPAMCSWMKTLLQRHRNVIRKGSHIPKFQPEKKNKKKMKEETSSTALKHFPKPGRFNRP